MATIIFKTIEKCNSNCIYCDTIKKKQEKVMSHELMQIVFMRINEYLVDNLDDDIQLTWHGGEIGLLGAEYFQEARKFQERHCSQTKGRIKHLIQSNLTLVNQEMIDVFHQLGITNIGTSYEPIPGIRGFGAKRDSKAYNRRFMEGINLLKQNNIQWGLIYVVNKKSLEKPLEIFHHLINLNPMAGPNFNMIICYDDTLHDLNITPEEYVDFMGEIFLRWWPDRDRYPNINPLSRHVNNLDGKALILGCELSGDCANKWLYIGPNGETSQCGRSGDFHGFPYGDIQERSIQELLHDNKRNDFKKRQQLLPETDCSVCRFWGICHGGCALEPFFTYGDMMRKSPNCYIVKGLMEKYVEPATGLKADFRPTGI